MPYYQNSLYGRGVPSYAEQLSPLADVFKAFAPNPLRDLQVQGYVSKAHLADLKGQQITQELDGANAAADQFHNKNTQGVYENTLRGGNPQMLAQLPKFVEGGYAARAIDDPNSVNQDTLATLAVGAGGNYKNTVPGFKADQSRQLQQNENTVAASRYGSELQAGASRYGADRQAAVGFDRNAKSLQGTQYSANKVFDASHYATDERTKVGLDANEQRLTGAKYGADQRRGGTVEAAQVKAGNRGGAAAQFKVDPVKLDNVLLQSLPGSFKDAKGRWNTDPSVTPADLAEVRARVASYVQTNPADQYGAVQRAVADVYGDAPSITPEVQAESNWTEPDVPYAPPQVVALPQDKRPPRPGLGQQFAAPPPVSAPAVPSMPNAPVAGAAPNADLAAAKNAIAAGKSRQAVVQRLIQGGYSAEAIQAAGI
ncbi:hypothetical protein [Pseudomonas sp. BF-R-21]|uniref:hypothetical protein n=1 Tax=Pseudomonas sp. BF-R-21 TaxID=2832387 RepID=UPI001CBDDB4C|nr:hypothetical protein [Pseudomonas sp. BF-R-21]